MNNNDLESTSSDNDFTTGCLLIFVSLIGIVVWFALIMAFIEAFAPVLIAVLVACAFIPGGSDPDDPYDYRNRYR